MELLTLSERQRIALTHPGGADGSPAPDLVEFARWEAGWRTRLTVEWLPYGRDAVMLPTWCVEISREPAPGSPTPLRRWDSRLTLESERVASAILGRAGMRPDDRFGSRRDPRQPVGMRVVYMRQLSPDERRTMAAIASSVRHRAARVVR